MMKKKVFCAALMVFFGNALLAARGSIHTEAERKSAFIAGYLDGDLLTNARYEKALSAANTLVQRGGHVDAEIIWTAIKARLDGAAASSNVDWVPRLLMHDWGFITRLCLLRRAITAAQNIDRTTGGFVQSDPGGDAPQSNPPFLTLLGLLSQ